MDHFPRRLGAGAIACVLLAAPGAALAQRAGDMAITEADDAFGGMVGLEAVGIYTETDVRGFNPQQAGNARVDGMYFDQLAVFPGRLRGRTTIRVGVTALDYIAPAPTGIVAYQVRKPLDEYIATASVQALQYGGLIGELDFLAPISERFDLAGGFAGGRQYQADGAPNDYVSYSLVPTFRFGEVEVKALTGGILNRPQQTRPLVTTSGPFTPPVLDKGPYLGQSWADNRISALNYALLIRAPLAEGVEARASIFRSQLKRHQNFTEIYRVTRPDGLAQHLLVADPRQNSWSDSGEALLQRRFGEGALRHVLVASVRGRRRHIESGGSNSFNFGMAQLGTPDREAKPAFNFTRVNLGRVEQWNYSVGYIGRYKTLAQLNLGLTKADYKARFRAEPTAAVPRVVLTQSEAHPWLGNVALLVRPTPRFAAYAGYVRGLEDNGSAPETANNRNQQLPASRTSQIDGGVKIDVGQMHLVASAFEIKKPYFSLDATNLYGELGSVRHRGIEVSMSGNLTERLRILSGVVLIDPVVTGPGRASNTIGPRPIGVAKLRTRLDASYRLSEPNGATLLLTYIFDSPRPASATPSAALGGRQPMIPSRGVLDLGVRYDFTVADRPTSLRAVVGNVLNEKSWKVLASNTFQQEDYRRLNVYLTMDF